MQSTRPLVPVWRSGRWLAGALLLWVACSAAYFLTAPGRIDMFDGGIRHEVTESLIEIGVPAVRDPAFPGIPGRWGYRYAWYELGSSITAIPFVLVGRALGHGSLESKQFAFSMTTVPFAAAVAALLFLIYGRLGVPLKRALAWALVFAFGTLMWPYAGSSFDAALQAFWLTLAVWSAVEAFEGRSIRWAVVSAIAFAMLINVQEAYVVLVGCAAATAPLTLASVRQRLRDPVVIVVLAGGAAGLLLIAGANFVRYGDPTNTGRMITTGTHPVFGNPLVGLAGLLVSPAKSIFLYSPTCCIAGVGLMRLMKSDARRLAPIPACIVLHLALISLLRFWHGEWAWGPRYLVATLPLVSIGLPFASRSSSGRRIGAVVAAVAVAVQILAVSVDHQRYYFDRSLTPFFWLDESKMYTDSPLLARPRELVLIARGNVVKHARALVPGPRPMSMTSSIFGPPAPQLALGRMWTRQYVVFDVPRPWTFWGRRLPAEQRPGNVELMTIVGGVIALAGFAALAMVAFARDEPDFSAVAIPES